MKRSIILALCILAHPIFAINQAAARQQPADKPPLAPAFSLKDLRGRSVRLDDQKGRVLLINFWATWCAPCLAEMPDLVKLQKEYGPRGLQIIGITYPPVDRAGVRRMVRRLKINYTILFGSDKTAKDYDVGEVLPATIVVDREGKIRARILGILESEEFDEKVKPLLTTSAER
ncbi:MAG TPA: TlpA disulfide reductase family protein [Blastocatellia bacterium]|jgi:cytochrome c biogenesis protein CcmG/thiol:disulfide interchange protein DsbE